MSSTYARRFRMEIDLRNIRPPRAVLPDGFRWIPWHPSTIVRHAHVKHRSFHGELDAQVFPSLSDFEGCFRLMNDIASQTSFVRQTTWLLVRDPDDWHEAADVGTIQGMAQSDALGSIQNVGIVPEFRGMGLGRALVLKALDGFLRARMKRVYLEVTASNVAAVSLYRSVGFKLLRTMFKEMPPRPQEPLVAEPLPEAPLAPEMVAPETLAAETQAREPAEV